MFPYRGSSRLRPGAALHGPCTGRRRCRRGEASPAPCSSGTWSPAPRCAGCCWPRGGDHDASWKYASWGHPRLTSVSTPAGAFWLARTGLSPILTRCAGVPGALRNTICPTPGRKALLPYSKSGSERRRTLAARCLRVNAPERLRTIYPADIPGDGRTDTTARAPRPARGENPRPHGRILRKGPGPPESLPPWGLPGVLRAAWPLEGRAVTPMKRRQTRGRRG